MKDFAKEIFAFLNNLPEVKECKIYGSVSTGNTDEFSDLDIMVDVSGIDNGVFLTKLPNLFEEKYRVSKERHRCYTDMAKAVTTVSKSDRDHRKRCANTGGLVFHSQQTLN